MPLNTLQHRIHRVRLEADMDSLYDETEQFYADSEISYNVAKSLWRELNKRFKCSFGAGAAHYDFFDGIVGGAATFDSSLISFDSDGHTFDEE